MAIAIWEYGADPELANNSVTNIQVIEGNPITTTEQFLDESGVPQQPLSGYPIAQILENGQLITQSVGYFKTQQQSDGTWFADLTIPNGFDFEGKPDKVLTLTWICKTLKGTERTSLHITVLPRDVITNDTDDNEIITLGPVTELSVRVPYIINVLAGDVVNFTIYDNNMPVFKSICVASNIQGASTVLTLPVSGVSTFSPRLRPYGLILDIKFPTASRQVFTQVRLINPSLLGAMQSLEMAINKANQVETIRGLQFREADLLEGLTRGLDYFNNVPPSLTSFTGIDMRGSIREGWLICASIRVLRAQLQAEGWFNFDFSGQAVSLNVDRTQAVETAASHYEGLIDTLVRPTKMLLAKKGVISGDGSVGDRLASMSSMGVTRISNTPLTRSKLGNAIYPRN